MKNKVSSLLSLLLVVFGLSAIKAMASNQNDNDANQLKIKLVAGPGFASAAGQAEFNGGTNQMRFQVDVQVGKKLGGTNLIVSVDGSAVGMVALDKNGKGELRLRSDKGDTVPAVQKGSLVGVSDAGGDIILAGQF